MIEIRDKKQCCGCEACVQRCPKHSISLYEDEEGFLYPKVDHTTCIRCGLCEEVCPVINQGTNRDPIQVYAAKNNKEDQRIKSSSGGIFTLLAENILKEGGVVFGAKWDEKWQVIIDKIETTEDIEQIRGAKYVQAHVGDSYKKAENILKAGTKVLYTGTPCQISGLKKYLRRDYEQLICVEIICHGVPSPGVLKSYLREKLEQAKSDLNSKTITEIQFRDKRQGWKNYSVTIRFRTDQGDQHTYTNQFQEDLFMRGFIANLYLRPSCHNCPAKQLKSGSDITLGDAWGIEKEQQEWDDDKGISYVLLNTEKGKNRFDQLTLDKKEFEFTKVKKYNPALIKSEKPHKKRKKFFRSYSTHPEIIGETIEEQLRESRIKKIKKNIRKTLQKTYRKIINK